MISLNSVSKKFILENSKMGSLDFLKKILNSEKKEELFSLNEVSLNVNVGEVVGVIGNNGSGKSTLLKIIAEILSPTKGKVNVVKNAVYISGFSNGINKNLSMLDNIYIAGTLNGLSIKEIKLKIPEIVEFSELKDFLFVPLYKFSTGMVSRFSFATMIFTLPQDPEILLLDEVLGAGADASFKQKIYNKIDAYIKSAKVVVVVSHNLQYVLKECSRVVWLDKGIVIKDGNPEDVVKEYLEFLK